jgi:hypothetical protein
MSYTTFLTGVMVLQLIGAVWLTRRGRKVGYFFGLVAVAALISLR